MGGKDAPALRHFQQKQRCAEVSLGNTHETPSLRNALGMQAFLLATVAFSADPGSQPSSSLSRCPTSQHQAPNPSPPSPREHWRDFTSPSGTGTCWAYLGQQNKHWICRILSKAGLGAATAVFRGEPGCPTAQCTARVYTRMLSKSASPVATFEQLLMIWSLLTDSPTKNTTRVINLRDWYKIAHSLFSSGITIGDKLST